jgi:hypothetical protein
LLTPFPTLNPLPRFISWLHQSAKYSAQCNIIAFIYIKRMMDAKCILTMSNWRGMWLGSVVLAQKVWDDSSLRTSSFASILPGVSKSQLKGLELKIFTLLGYCTSVKPSVYARFYFELREIFKSITGEFCDASLQPPQAPRRRPLTIKKGKFLRQCVDDLTAASARSSKASSPRASKTSASASSAQSGASVVPAAGSPSAAQHRSSAPNSAVKFPAIKLSPSATGRVKSFDDGAGGGQRAAQRTGAESSSAATPGRASRERGEGRRLPVTLEDYDYINSSSIFVLS